MSFDIENVLQENKQFLRRVERFHDRASNFLTGIVLTVYGRTYIINVGEGVR